MVPDLKSGGLTSRRFESYRLRFINERKNMSYYTNCEGEINILFEWGVSDEFKEFVRKQNDDYEEMGSGKDIREFDGIEKYKFFPYFYLDLDYVSSPVKLKIVPDEEKAQLYQLKEYINVLNESFQKEGVMASEGLIKLFGEETGDVSGISTNKNNELVWKSAQLKFSFDEE